ncbi:MAG: DUF4136 domain-containing protein [Glaciimonas sp.]|nr:DUF4136 domain-containing protein [Glaciimonas sp.]
MRNVRLALLAIIVLLSGCASTIRSNVTVFHAWPPESADKSFVFEHKKSLEDDLEYQSYQRLLRAQLQQLGFTDATNPKTAALRVAFDYGVTVRDVRLIQPVLVDPYGYGGGFYAPRFHRRSSFYNPFYDPFYDPFWYGPPVVAYQQIDYQLYHRQLHVGIVQARDGKKLYDVTVDSEGRNSALASVMPYMMRSAFVGFPGTSGVARQVELPVKD